jgi:acyl-CoA synthetase (AMP-forming)/AMP-acid ligase II
MANTVLTMLSAEKVRDFYARGFWRDETIYGAVSAHAASGPNRFAMRDRSRRFTYAQIIEAADRVAANLERRGLQSGDRVAVWLPSRTESAIVLLACSRNGYVCCPSLHRDHTSGEIIELLKRMGAAALFSEIGYGADAHRRSIFDQLADITSLRAVHRLAPLKETSGMDLFPGPQGNAAHSSPRTDPDTVIYLAFTSGTTGIPKGVMHTDNTLLANARAMSDDWDLKQDTILYSLSPLSHNLGLGALVLTLSQGGEFVVHDLPPGASLVDRLLEVDVTFIIGVPTHAIDLLGEMRARNLNRLGRVKGFRISGAAIAPGVAAGLLEHGVVPQSGYGMTEAGSHHYTRPDDPPERIVESCGRVCAGYEVKIWSREDRNVEVPIGEAGEIGGRGACLMLGYFDDQEATESSFNRDGWFMTGDLGRVDAEGYLQITGRKKDMIIRGGHNIYPARLEALVLRHKNVAGAAVIPIADERLGEKACLVVVPRGGHNVSADDVLTHLDEVGLSRFDMPEYFLRVDKLPLTANGKISKSELVDKVRAGDLKPAPVRFVPPEKRKTAP